MRFLIDAQLPPSLAQSLRDAGFDAVHVADINMLATSDREIWDKAVAQCAVLVTKDRDFAELRAVRSIGPTVLWLRIGNATNRALIDQVLRAMPSIVDAVARGETVVELSRR